MYFLPFIQSFSLNIHRESRKLQLNNVLNISTNTNAYRQQVTRIDYINIILITESIKQMIL